jgi:hypothetical protein
VIVLFADLSSEFDLRSSIVILDFFSSFLVSFLFKILLFWFNPPFALFSLLSTFKIRSALFRFTARSGKVLTFGFFFRKSVAGAGLVNMTLRFGKLCTFYLSEYYSLKVLYPSWFSCFLSLFIANQHEFRFH